MRTHDNFSFEIECLYPETDAIRPVGFVEATTTNKRLLFNDVVLARKCGGASIAESEPAQWSQPQDDSWDRLYEIVTSECGNNRLPRAETVFKVTKHCAQKYQLSM